MTDLLLAARRSGVPVDPLDPALVPGSAEAAYAVQNEIVAALGPVGAWKVTPKLVDGACFAAPILLSGVYPSGATLKAADLRGIGIEVEVAVTIGQICRASRAAILPKISRRRWPAFTLPSKCWRPATRTARRCRNWRALPICRAAAQ
ncbi:hypothetical protein N8D56_05835 [Devosia sp. A8/3-2]|nr:hypothetical protein N8D56_05835 [Devosia sp. A8/3-2]